MTSKSDLDQYRAYLIETGIPFTEEHAPDGRVAVSVRSVHNKDVDYVDVFTRDGLYVSQHEEVELPVVDN